jgi:hypothetical protein
MGHKKDLKKNASSTTSSEHNARGCKCSLDNRIGGQIGHTDPIAQVSIGQHSAFSFDRDSTNRSHYFDALTHHSRRPTFHTAKGQRLIFGN